MRSIQQALSAFKTKAKPFYRSITIWVGALITALPDVLMLLQANWPDIAAMLPEAWREDSVRLIGVAVLICRALTLVKQKKQTGDAE